MEFPEDLSYTDNDEWVRRDGQEALVGITDYAQDQLGDVVYVELPSLGQQVRMGEAFGVVESVKAVSDLFAPISGEVIARNDALEATPELLNQDPYGGGWIIRIRIEDESELEGLLSSVDYRAQREDANAP